MTDETTTEFPDLNPKADEAAVNEAKKLFVPFPSIEQFKNLVRAVSVRATTVKKSTETEDAVYDSSLSKPTLTLRGTVKVHGTNAAITLTPDGKILAQSRAQVLVAPDDNYGFRAWVEKLPVVSLAELFFGVATAAMGKHDAPPIMTIFGEWAGRGIQSGVGVSQVDKFFYMFAAKVNDEWIDMSKVPDLPDLHIYNAHSFSVWEVEIDFNDPESVAVARNRMVEITESVEKLCPVANTLLRRATALAGETTEASEIANAKDCTGEGVVWTCITPGFCEPQEDRRDTGGSQGLLWCKVKGEKHSASKVKTLASVDVEKVKSVQEFLDKTVTEVRFNQGIEALKAACKPVTIQSTGDFVRWVTADILKEDKDTMEASGLTSKDVGAGAGPRSQKWFRAFVERLDNNVIDGGAYEDSTAGER